jgi:hypothetical protein
MPAVLIVLAAMILVLGTATLCRSVPVMKDLSELVVRHPAWTAATMLLAVIGVVVGTEAAMSRGPSVEHVTAELGCGKVIADAFGTHWLNEGGLPPPITGPGTFSTTGVIRRVSNKVAIFTPDNLNPGGIVLHRNPGGFVDTDCAIQ